MQQGSEVTLEASAKRDRLHFTLDGEERAVNTRGCVRNLGGVSLVGEMDLARMNDAAFHSAHAKAVAEELVAQGVDVQMSQFSQAIVSPTSAHLQAAPHPSPPPAFVLDLCGAWGLAGLLVAQLVRCDGNPATRVLAVAEGEETATILNTLAKENGLGPDRYVATADRLVDLASRGEVVYGACASDLDDSAIDQSSRDAVGDSTACRWPGRRNEIPSTNRWSVVMASSLVEGSGLLKQGGLGDLELCRRFVCADGGDSGTGENRSATFVPGSLEVICQGLQRASLQSESRVQSGCCCGVDVTPVNAFGVANFRELDLSAAAPCDAEGTGQSDCGNTHADGIRAGAKPGCSGEEEAFLTAPVVCYELDLADVKAAPDGCLKRRTTRLQVRRGGTLHAVAYWYRQRPRAPAGSEYRVVLDTGPHASVHGQGYSSHFRQAAVLLAQPIEVVEGQCIDLSVFCNSSVGAVVQLLDFADTEALPERK